MAAALALGASLLPLAAAHAQPLTVGARGTSATSPARPGQSKPPAATVSVLDAEGKPEPTTSAESPPKAAAGADKEQIRFEADAVQYQSPDAALGGAQASETVTATGNVVLRRDDQTVRADAVTWDRKTGQIVATGNIRLVDPSGNVLYTERVELTDAPKTGAIDNLLLVLREGGRLAAAHGVRDAVGVVQHDKAAYSGRPVGDSDGCPRKPS
ncbi:MAG: LPS-assembly protein LptD, partial [Novosphingobium sp.]|nr:LPS-assembly protein LptD [Novosphingobium sp.]